MATPGGQRSAVGTGGTDSVLSSLRKGSGNGFQGLPPSVASSFLPSFLYPSFPQFFPPSLPPSFPPYLASSLPFSLLPALPPINYHSGMWIYSSLSSLVSDDSSLRLSLQKGEGAAEQAPVRGGQARVSVRRSKRAQQRCSTARSVDPMSTDAS